MFESFDNFSQECECGYSLIFNGKKFGFLLESNRFLPFTTYENFVILHYFLAQVLKRNCLYNLDEDDIDTVENNSLEETISVCQNLLNAYYLEKTYEATEEYHSVDNDNEHHFREIFNISFYVLDGFRENNYKLMCPTYKLAECADIFSNVVYHNKDSLYKILYFLLN